MKVGDLISALSNYPKDLDVVTYVQNDNGHNERYHISIYVDEDKSIVVHPEPVANNPASDPQRRCVNCVHIDISPYNEPCITCRKDKRRDKFQQRKVISLN